MSNSKGIGTMVSGFAVNQEKVAIVELDVEVPKNAKTATVFAVGHLTAYNSVDGSAGFLYLDVYAGNDFGTEMHADFDTEKWNSVVASNQTELDVSDLEEVKVELHVRAEAALDIEPSLSRAVINGIVVFE